MTCLVFDDTGVEESGRALLSQVDLKLEAGEFIALLGPNGAGKTTLLRAALGLVSVTHGCVLLDGKPSTELTPAERAARLAWLPQHPSASEPVRTLERVAAARFRFRENDERSFQAAEAALQRVGASHLAQRRITEISGGEAQRVALAALLAQEAPLLLLDEPANHLDPAQQLEVYRLLGTLWREGYGILCVTHDVNLLRYLGDPERVRIAGIDEGKLSCQTHFGALELDRMLSDLFGVSMRAITTEVGRVVIPLETPRT